MNYKLLKLAIGVTLLSQMMCNAFPFTESAWETETPSPTATRPDPTIESSVTSLPPTLTNTSEPSATTLPPTFTPTIEPTNTPTLEFIALGDICVPDDTASSINVEVLQNPNFHEEIADFLNGGGALNELENSFALQIPSGEHTLVRAIPYDFTGDGVLDVLFTLTIPYGNGLGASHVLAFRCENGRYESDILFRRAGAGARAEDLYTGGGAVIKNLADLNGNGIADVLIEVNWPGYQEHFLLEWDGTKYQSLIYYVDILGMEKYHLEVADGQVQVVDVDADGVFELEVTGIDFNTGNIVTVIWRWDGELYTPEE